MNQVADGVWQLRGFPPNAINVYLVEDVLVDAASRFAGRRILRQLAGYRVSAHVVTHAHGDHQGASHEVCERLGIPLWVGENDADAIEDPSLIAQRQPDHWLAQFYARLYAGPAHPVARPLREGDDVADFRVLDTPGHSAGHICLFRDSDRVLIAGDVVANMDTATGMPGLHEPRWFFSPDPAGNRESARRLGSLEPSVVLFGHGAPLRDTRKFVDFIAGLPA
jgi:hydroxyacylglutathione hydrolase